MNWIEGVDRSRSGHLARDSLLSSARTRGTIRHMSSLGLSPFSRVLAVLFFVFSFGARAQAPAATPSGTTGVCNDGTYSTAASKRGACTGHKGVRTWLGDSAAAAPVTPAPVTPANPAPVPATTRTAPASTAAKIQAPGGGNGQVWVNTASNVYHCQGDRNYGTTKAGAYMSEADAKAKGARAAYNKPCTR